jgi:uncharacterized membrane protein
MGFRYSSVTLRRIYLAKLNLETISWRRTVPYYLIAGCIGVVVGLRTLLPIAALSWAAHLGHLNLAGTWFAFLSYAASPYIFTVLAVLELVNDKLPKTPSRKVPAQFGARLLFGAFSGAAVGANVQAPVGGAIAGLLGAVIGTLGGAELRGALARAFGKDLPAALTEDAIAIVAAVMLVSQLS